MVVTRRSTHFGDFRRARRERESLRMNDVRVRLGKPLGIVFEECEPGGSEGVRVASLVEGGNADVDGKIFVGDKLTEVSAVVFGGEMDGIGGKLYSNWKREMIPCGKLEFNTIMSGEPPVNPSMESSTLTLPCQSIDRHSDFFQQ